MSKERLITLSLIVLAAAASRLLPHPVNVAPMAAMALFSGAQFGRSWLAFAVPLAALLLSDAVIGFYPGMWVTYLGFAAVVCLGFLLQNNQSASAVFLASFSGSVLFFLITNCALWPHYDLYPKTFEGVVQGYVAGLPFFRNAVWGDLFYSALLFGGFALARRRYSSLKAA